MRARSLFPLKVFRIEDRSMEPALSGGDYVVVSLWRRDPGLGDIAVLLHPKNGTYIVKRIKRRLGNRYFVLGDNAKLSEDSREFGAVAGDKIVGTVLFKI